MLGNPEVLVAGELDFSLCFIAINLTSHICPNATIWVAMSGDVLVCHSEGRYPRYWQPQVGGSQGQWSKITTHTASPASVQVRKPAYR